MRWLLRFAEISDSDFDVALAKLANLAQPEPGEWLYRHAQSNRPYPILRSYILHTFNRIQDEGKIAEIEPSAGPRLACFNTGLVTPRQEPIYAVFRGKSSGSTDRSSWSMDGFFRESERILTHFPTRPDLANYFTDPAELLYDPRVELVVDVDHILGDNKERFPAELRSNDFTLRTALESAIAAAKRRVRRNYKAAIPHFHRGKIQLLLPLCLALPERADLALVVARENQVYRASTVLTLDMAYNNARLIARPDTEWLDP